MYDLSGQRFGRLQVVDVMPSEGKGRERKWLCQCDCGSLTVVRSYSLRKQGTKSCGCLVVEFCKSQDRSRHGMYNTRTYHTWEGMKQRCQNPNATRYPDYGAIGITVCDRWQLFDNFFADMGERPEGKTLDRIDPFGNYEPGNCRWATPYEQQHNQRRHRKTKEGT